MVAVASCGAFVAIAEPMTIALLRRAAAMDVPNLRSSHTVATPRGGGVPIAGGLVAVAVVIRSPAAAAFGLAVAIFAAIGLADDLAGLEARRRLMLQAAGSVAVAIVLLRHLGLPLVPLAIAAAVVAVWVAAVVNAFNFMDGVNGISAAHAVIGGAAYACLGVWCSDVFLVAAGGAVAAGALAFFPWNAVSARVFLGDVGSYGLGAALAVLAVCAVIRGVPVDATLGPLALYLADTGWTLQRRIRSGERWLEAHRTHVYQQWCDIGLSHQRVTAVTAAATLLVCLLGMASLTGDIAVRTAADFAALCVLAAYLRSPAFIGRIARLLERA
jgi:UDP-GlcNAc:undecaprenyl-phosphate/decaprenyl-phosphate GlcNAc-1-phosphate transferase